MQISTVILHVVAVPESIFLSSGTRQHPVTRMVVTECSDFLNIDLPQFRGYPFLSRFRNTIDLIFHRNLPEKFSSKDDRIAAG
jgi:hypothetical protein